MTDMAPATLILGAMACLLLALALWMFARAHRKEQARSVQSHLQRSLDILPSQTAIGGMQSLPGVQQAASASAVSSSTPHGTWSRLHSLLQRHLGIDAWGIAPRMLALQFTSKKTKDLVQRSGIIQQNNSTTHTSHQEHPPKPKKPAPRPTRQQLKAHTLNLSH